MDQNGRLTVGVTVWYPDVFVRLIMIHVHTKFYSCLCMKAAGFGFLIFQGAL